MWQFRRASLTTHDTLCVNYLLQNFVSGAESSWLNDTRRALENGHRHSTEHTQTGGPSLFTDRTRGPPQSPFHTVQSSTGLELCGGKVQGPVHQVISFNVKTFHYHVKFYQEDTIAVSTYFDPTSNCEQWNIFLLPDPVGLSHVEHV